jgi:Leucine-rich repeat (LRR) protein
VLDLSNNVIERISDGALVNLTTVYLNSNHIEIISSATFTIVGQTKLGLMHVAEQILHEHSALQVLDLSWNSISHISEGAFASLPKLEVLNLSQNSIRQLSEGAFQSLTSL